MSHVALVGGHALNFGGGAVFSPDGNTTPQCAAPTFSPSAGAYASAQTVSLSCSTPLSTIYYTTNGTTPTTSSTPYSGPITVSSTETIEAIATAPGYTQSQLSTATYTIGSSATVPVGMNLSAVSYYSNEQPFLNIIKSAGSSAASSGGHGWFTATASLLASGQSSGEEAFLQLDANGYPTSVNGAAQGKTFTLVWTAVNLNINNVSGVQYNYGYAGVSYTVQFQGAGTILIGRDASATITSSGQTFTVATPSFYGLYLAISSTDPLGVGNYIRNISVVETPLLASFNAGAQFHPKFLATIPSYNTLRFMDWMCTNIVGNNFPTEATPMSTSSGTISQGATNCTLANPWPYPSQTRNVYFNDGEVRSATFVAGSYTMDWSSDSRGGLTNAITQTFAGQDCYCNFWLAWHDVFANRSLPSNCFWSLNAGVPLEIIVALCNETGSNAYLNLPLITSSFAYYTSFHQLIYSGTGMQSGFSPLNSNINAYIEVSNETWNFGFNQFSVCGSLGSQIWPGQAANNGPSSGNTGWSRNYYGYLCAVASEIAFSVWSGSFASRCFPILACQGPDTTQYSASYPLSTPYWTSAIGGYVGPASAHKIVCLAIAGYWMDGYPSQADADAMFAQSDGGLTALFQCFTTNVTVAGTLSSVPSNGWLGQAESQIAGYVGFLAANYPNLKLIAYEGGQNILEGGTLVSQGGTLPDGWPTLAEAAQIDSRMGTQFYNYLHWWLTNVGATAANINCIYDNCNSRVTYSNASWGVLESVQQTLSPLSAAPPKWQQIQTVIAGN